MRPDGLRPGSGGQSSRSSGERKQGWISGKRSRTPPSTSSRNPRPASRNSFKRSRGVHDVVAGPSSQSPSAMNDKFVDDVRFDAVTRDMCGTGDCGSKGGGDSDTVVQRQLSSLGSVLIGASKEGGKGASGKGKSTKKGTREDVPSGENLLTRWLRPAQSRGLPGQSSSAVDTGVARQGSSALDDPDAEAITTAKGVGERSWAEKALLRKKMADAEKGRRMRLQQEAFAAASPAILAPLAGSIGGPDSNNARPQIHTDGHPHSSESGKGIGVEEEGKSQFSACHNGGVERVITSAAAASVTVDPSSRTRDRSSAITATRSRAQDPCIDGTTEPSAFSTPAGHGKSPGMPAIGPGMDSSQALGNMDDDEYGDDDFSFLSDAELQQMEELATREAAASRNIQGVSQQQIVSTGIARGKEGHGTHVGVECVGSPSQTEPVSVQIHEQGVPRTCRGLGVGTATQSRSVGPRSRPPLATVAAVQSRSSKGGWCHRVVGTHGRQGVGGFLEGKKAHGQVQGGNISLSSEVTNRPVINTIGCSSSSRGGGRVLGGVPNTNPNPEQAGEVGKYAKLLAGPAHRHAGREHGQDQGKGFPGPELPDSSLFTSYSSMEKFTCSNKSAQPLVAGQASITGWVGKGGEPGWRANLLPGDGSVSGGTPPCVLPPLPTPPHPPAPPQPGLVHHRYLVLEVTQRAVSRPTLREKLLVALEQEVTLEQGAAPEQGGGATLAGEGPCGRPSEGGGLLSSRQQISLRGDWYDSEVEPGDVVHVVFLVRDGPAPPGAGLKARGKGGGKGGGEGGKETTGRGGAGAGPGAAAIVVDNTSGSLLVLQPDILVSPTRVADAILCRRKVVLQSRVSSDAAHGRAAVLGTLKHELFEASLLDAAEGDRVGAMAGARVGAGTEAPWSGATGTGRGHAAVATRALERSPLSLQGMRRLVDRIVVARLESLYGAGVDEETARHEL
ncbi:unnamed protein product, partial [Discosporangium mesarthrocarpum]